MKKKLVIDKMLMRTELTWRDGDILDIDIYEKYSNLNVNHVGGICLRGSDLDQLIRFLVNHHLK